MRIAFVCADPGVPVFGRKGASVHIQEIVRAFLGQGIGVELFAVRSGEDIPADLTIVPFHQLSVPAGNDVSAREQAQLRSNDGLRMTLDRAGPFDAVYERHALWSFAAMEYARATGIPGLLEVNAPLIEEQAAHRALVDRPGAETAAARAVAAASVLLAVSDALAGHLQRYPQARGRIHVVPNGVSAARFPERLRASLPAAPGVFTVGFVGSLKPWHGLPVLVDACALLHREDPRLRLLIVGDGPERTRLLGHLFEHGLHAVAHLTGAVDPAEVPGFLASMDVGMATYQDQGVFYFSPLKVYEYMAAGLPVVASRIGQPEALIEDGVTGLLCPPGDPAAVARALGRLRQDPHLRARLGQAARAAVLTHHTWDARVRRILSLAELNVVAASEVGRWQ